MWWEWRPNDICFMAAFVQVRKDRVELAPGLDQVGGVFERLLCGLETYDAFALNLNSQCLHKVQALTETPPLLSPLFPSPPPPSSFDTGDWHEHLCSGLHMWLPGCAAHRLCCWRLALLGRILLVSRVL